MGAAPALSSFHRVDLNKSRVAALSGQPDDVPDRRYRPLATEWVRAIDAIAGDAPDDPGKSMPSRG